MTHTTTLMTPKQASAILEELDKMPRMDEAAIKQTLPQLLKKNGVVSADIYFSDLEPFNKIPENLAFVEAYRKALAKNLRLARKEGLENRCKVEYRDYRDLPPDVRFDKHKAGIQANKFVQKFGLRLLTELYEIYNPMPYDGARDMEEELAIGLREAGYGVWQA